MAQTGFIPIVAALLVREGRLFIARKPEEVVQHDLLGFFGRPSP